MRKALVAQHLMVRFERGLRPRNLYRGDVRKGGGAPLRRVVGVIALAKRKVGGL